MALGTHRGRCPLLLAASGVIFYLATLYPAGPPQRGTLALVGATVLTCPELEPQPDATVLIGDGVIIEVGPAGTVAVPSDATSSISAASPCSPD